MGERKIERETLNLKQAPGSELSHSAWRWARTHEPWDHDLSQSRTLNRLSHPGTPRILESHQHTVHNTRVKCTSEHYYSTSTVVNSWPVLFLPSLHLSPPQLFWNKSQIPVTTRIFQYLGDIEDSVPHHCNTANLAKSESNEFFGFPVPIKVMFTLYYSLLSMQ